MAKQLKWHWAILCAAAMMPPALLGASGRKIMTIRSVSIALLFGLASAANAAAAELPKEWNYDTMHCFGGTITFVKHGKSHMAFNYHLSGASRSKTSDSPVGLLSSQCLGVGSVIEGASSTNGFCEFIDADGDKFFGVYDRTGPSGTWKVLSGTGKFTGITGGGTYDRIRFPRGLLAGTFSGCSDGKGSYKLP